VGQRQFEALASLFLHRPDGPPTSPLVNRIARLAPFQNPEFYAAQAIRLSTFGKPRVISCAELFSKHAALPSGCLDDLLSLLGDVGIKAKLGDERQQGQVIEPGTEKRVAKYIFKPTEPDFLDHFHLRELHDQHGPQGTIYGRLAIVSPAVGATAGKDAEWDPSRPRRPGCLRHYGKERLGIPRDSEMAN
jgi:hypothetical protein